MRINQVAVVSVLSFLALTSAVAKTHKPHSPLVMETFYSDERRYNIAERGAIGDGKTLNTKVIQTVVEECARSGGGTILIPKSVFLSGALFLKPGVNIELQEGAVLKGSTDINDYPKLNTRIEGHFEP